MARQTTRGSSAVLRVSTNKSIFQEIRTTPVDCDQLTELDFIRRETYQREMCISPAFRGTRLLPPQEQGSTSLTRCRPLSCTISKNVGRLFHGTNSSSQRASNDCSPWTRDAWSSTRRHVASSRGSPSRTHPCVFPTARLRPWG